MADRRGGGGGARTSAILADDGAAWGGTEARRLRPADSELVPAATSLLEQAPLSIEEPIEVEGTVSTVLPGTMFRVKLDNGHEMLAHLSGKMSKHFVRLTVGDRVRLEMSPYDLTKARITYRLR